MLKLRIPAYLVVLLASCFTLQAGNLIENFTDITTLSSSGWTVVNNSSPVGLTSWFQGNTSVFPAQAGPANSYIAANFDNAAFGGNISNWLMTPVLTFYPYTVMTFYTRTELEPPAADSLELRFSSNGASTNVGSTASSVGDFTTLLLSINPTLDLNGYPKDWAQVAVNFSGLSSPITGRLAFRYAVPDTSVNADYIGIDTVDIADIPEPATGGLIALGMAGVFLSRMFRRGKRS